MEAPIIRTAQLSAERPAGWVNDEHFPASLVAFVIETYSRPRYLEQMAEVFASIAGHLTPTGTLVLSVANIRTGETVTSLADDLVAVATRLDALGKGNPAPHG